MNDVTPLLVFRTEGPAGGSRGTTPGVLAIVACNEKSRNKSLERGELWIVDPGTGRVLPYRGGGVAYDGFVAGDEHWEVSIRDLDSGPTTGVGTDEGRDAEAPGAEVAGAAAAADPGIGAVLASLGDLIARRHETMPEGSYTTHLFSKGPAKIRKKAGEEAVELILAESKDELLSEAADLIYHLMVLLEVEGLRIESVVEVLRKRHEEG